MRRANSEFRIGAAIAGLVLAGFYARNFAVYVTWRWLVALMLVSEALAVAALPAVLLDPLTHPTGAAKDIPPSLFGLRPSALPPQEAQ